jgi:Ca2+-binding RTX toxin-like protein
VLYSASRGEFYATALSGDAPGYADLASDGTLTLRGTPGSDHLYASQGTDIVGDGSDEVYVQRERWGRTFSGVRRVLIDAGSGDDYISGHTFTLPATVAGAAGSDIIRFYGDGDALIGGGIGDDRFDIGGSNFDVDGGPGIDRIEVWGDNNTIQGGAGDDTILADAYPPDGVALIGSTLRGGDGNDSITTRGRRGYSVFSIFGDAGDDYLRSGFTSDTLTGGPGADTLRSGGGIDIFNTDPDDTFASA